MSVEAALGLGGNLGDPVAAFAAALGSLRAHEAVELTAISSVYRTPPWGRLDQPDFLNMAALVETSLKPQDLLALCLRLEREAGRERRERWGPRTLDIDILTYGDRTIDEPGLTVPHPRLSERAFALVPLAQIAPALVLENKRLAEHTMLVREPGLVIAPEETRRLRGLLV